MSSQQKKKNNTSIVIKEIIDDKDIRTESSKKNKINSSTSTTLPLEDSLKLAEDLLLLEKQEQKTKRVLTIGTFIDPEQQEKQRQDKLYKDFTEWIAFLEKMKATMKCKQLHTNSSKKESDSNESSPVTSPNSSPNIGGKRRARNQTPNQQGKENTMMKLLRMNSLDDISKNFNTLIQDDNT
jgi:hypothetical protein